MSSESSHIQLKEKQVHALIEKMKQMNTLMIVSIRGLPSKQFQEIKKSIRKDASVKIARKNIMVRAVDGFKKESLLPLKQYIDSDIAFVLSEKDGYELARILAQKKTRVFAKAGQIADSDIEIKEGPTDLVPGPAISELGALGLQISVENGKIAIKTTRVVVKKGEAIKENVAAILQKLHIQPFNIGLTPIAIYDIKKEKIYTNILIDSDGYVQKLQNAAGKALGFAQKINFYCKETVTYFLAKAGREGKALQNKIGGEKQ